MSTKIKPGQTWQWNSALPNEGGIVVTSFDGERVRFRYEDGSIDGEHYRDTEHFTERAHLVKDVDPTPAPLDPTKVAITLKAGDYIEAESDGTKIGGPVSHVNENGFVSIQHLGSFAIEGITPPRAGYREFALTDHQPAPEPEPVWGPGTVGTATIRGVKDVRGAWATLHDGERYFVILEADKSGTGSLSSTAEHVTDFVPDETRPLPTRDQVYDALLVAYRDELGPVGGTEAAFLIRATTDTLAILTGGAR